MDGQQERGWRIYSINLMLTQEQHSVVYFRGRGKRGGRMWWIGNGLEKKKWSEKEDKQEKKEVNI